MGAFPDSQKSLGLYLPPGLCVSAWTSSEPSQGLFNLSGDGAPPGALEKKRVSAWASGSNAVPARRAVPCCPLRGLLERCHRILPFGGGREWPTDAQLGCHPADAVPSARPTACDIGHAPMVFTLAVQGKPVRICASDRTATGRQARVRRGHSGWKAVGRRGRDQTPGPCVCSRIA